MNRDARAGTTAAGALLVLAAAALWGTTGTAQALAPSGATPVTVGTLRAVIGGTLLFAFALTRRAVPAIRAWPVAPVACAAGAVALYQVAFFASVARAGVAVGTVVALGSAPVLAGLIARALGVARVDRGWWIATGLAVPGVTLLAGAPGAAGHADAWGVALALVAGGAFATYAHATKSLLAQGWRTEAAAGVGFFGGGVLLAPVLFVADASWAIASPRGVLVALQVGVVATAIANSLFTRGLGGVTSPAAVTLTLAEPVTASFLGVLVLGERLGVRGTVGAVLVLAGLLALTRSASRSRHSSRP